MGSGSSVACSIRLNTKLTGAQRALYQNPDDVKKILNGFRRIAIVGLSSNDQKASYFVASYLRSSGYEIIPVNPGAKTILGLVSYPDLKSIPGPIDLVDIFRPAQDVGAIVEDSIAIGAKAVWQQLKIVNIEAAARAREAGLISVVDLCVKMEHGRYSGGLHEGGMNTGLISSRRVHRFF